MTALLELVRELVKDRRNAQDFIKALPFLAMAFMVCWQVAQLNAVLTGLSGQVSILIARACP